MAPVIVPPVIMAPVIMSHRAAVAIGAAFGREGFKAAGQGRAQLPQHRLKHMVLTDQQAVRLDLAGGVAVADVPGQTRQIARHFQHRLGCGQRAVELEAAQHVLDPHDGIVHQRWFRWVPKRGYAKRLVQAHKLHHATIGKEGGVSFGFVFARRGITPEAASTWFLGRLVGMQTALEWCFTGRVFDAQEAKDRGLVRSLHAPDELLPAARALAREIADNTAPVSVALTRQMLWHMAGQDHPMKAHQVDSRAIQARGQSADAREGVSSFLEKRTPVYPNKVSTDMPDFFPWWDEPPFE